MTMMRVYYQCLAFVLCHLHLGNTRSYTRIAHWATLNVHEVNMWSRKIQKPSMVVYLFVATFYLSTHSWEAATYCLRGPGSIWSSTSQPDLWPQTRSSYLKASPMWASSGAANVLFAFALHLDIKKKEVGCNYMLHMFWVIFKHQQN